MSENSIAAARASVMIYDDVNKKWVPSGSSSGLSKVHIFQHSVNNTFRVVGRKLQDHEVVINCIILRSLKYNQATATFHQWRDNKQVYGLNFSSKDDADAFARAMNYAVEMLSAANKPPGPPMMNNMVQGNVPVSVTPANVSVQMMPQTNGHYEEDMGYRNVIPGSRLLYYAPQTEVQPAVINSEYSPYMRTMTKEDIVVLQERRMSQQPQLLGSPSSVSSVNTTTSNNAINQQLPPGHQRTSSAPPAPQPPPLSFNSSPPQPPPVPTAASIPAPPCPPPLPTPEALNKSKNGTNEPPEQGSLAAQLQSARLKRSNKQQSAENSGSSTSSGGSSNYGTLGRGQTGMASMMDEMAKTLARRRAAVEKSNTENIQEDTTVLEKKVWNNKSNSANGCESPKPQRKLVTSVSDEPQANKINGDTTYHSADLENLKQDILREMRKEIIRMKQEIIDTMKLELSKR